MTKQSKLITLYHCTDYKSSINIIKNGFNSHSWFASNSKRALTFGKMKTDNPILMVIKISKKELEKRALVKQQTPSKDCNKIIGYEYLLNSYKLSKIKPITEKKKEWCKKYPTVKMNRELFIKKVDDGQIMLGGLGNCQGVRLMRVTKNWIWFIK